MRFIRVVFSLLLLAFSFLVALAVMLIGLLAFPFVRRPIRPAFNVRFNRTGSTPPPGPVNRGDVIDVEATPVKD